MLAELFQPPALLHHRSRNHICTVPYPQGVNPFDGSGRLLEGRSKITNLNGEIMGIMKRRYEEQLGRESWALGFLVEVGALRECEIDEGTYFEGNADLQDACRRFNAQVTSGKIKLGKFETRGDYTDALKAVYEDNACVGECPWCLKRQND